MPSAIMRMAFLLYKIHLLVEKIIFTANSKGKINIDLNEFQDSP